MIKQIYFLTLLLAVLIGGIQGQTSSKLDLLTLRRLNKGEVRNENMALLVKGDITRIEQLTEQYGGRFKYAVKNIASIEIPEKNLIPFSNEYAVEQIENPNTIGHALMDSARIRNNIDSVQAGFAPLAHDLKGRGVIIGIIDGGIYWQHDDFKKANGDTRIRFIWDQGIANGAHKPLPYQYGDECSWLDINIGSCSHVEPPADSSHGTCVAGVAAGNGKALANDTLHPEKYTGVAPESEIISVRVDITAPNFAAHMADAVDYIFKKADALGMPCVINTSLGGYVGSHDGKDMTTEIIEALLDERNGRVLVAAAGNTGNVYYHVGYDVTPDTAYTYFKYNGAQQAALFDWWADTADFNHVQFAIGCNDVSGNDLGRTVYYTAASLLASNGIGGATLANNFQLLGSVTLKLTLTEGRYHIEVMIDPDQTALTFFWRLQTRGTGRLDMWSSAGLTGISDIVESIGGLSIVDTAYRHSDHFKTLASSWQCSDKVITVGNYSNRAGYLDVDSVYIDLVNTFPDPQTVGQRYFTSSFGPTRDNRLKPDVMATGNTTLCTGNLNDIANRMTNGGHSQVALGQKHMVGGTSLASAIVTGIAALYLEKRPTANYQEVKRALICTAVRDSFTGPNANSEYGNGKVNAFAAVTRVYCITFGAMDTTCLNYNPLANVDSGSCIAAVYGCMDSTADNYNPLANVSDGSCTYTGIKNIFGSSVSVRVIPNPFTEQTNFKIEGLNFDKGEIRIFNQLGAGVDAIALSGGKTDYTYHNSKLPKGVYYYVLNADGKNVKAGKLVVE